MLGADTATAGMAIPIVSATVDEIFPPLVISQLMIIGNYKCHGLI